MRQKFIEFLKDESGATAIEYGLVAALIGIACIVGLREMGQKNDNIYKCLRNINDPRLDWANNSGINADGQGPCAQFENR